MNESTFAKTILEQKYAHDTEEGKETWEQIAHRVAHAVLKAVGAPKSQAKETEAAIAAKKFIPGGRYLAASGRPFHQTQNCYGPETEVVTRHGTKTLKELADGQNHVLMTSEGRWVEAQVLSFGQQSLMKVSISRQGILKEIWATAGHSWRVAGNEFKDGRPAQKREVSTDKLAEGQKLWSVYGYGISRTPISEAGIQHGIVYGDGNVPGDEWGFNTGNVRLCGEKDAQLLKFFAAYPQRKIEDDTEVSGLPRHYKEPVSLLSDRSYLLGWLAGYFAADGCVSKEGAIVLYSTDEGSLKLVKDVCYLLGIGAYGIRYSDRISNLTERDSRLFSVALMRHTLCPEFFLVAEHRRRFIENPPKRSEAAWRVVSVESTPRVDEVFCAVVDGTHEFVLADNILTGNCLLMNAEDSREGWANIMHQATMGLMSGAGIGVWYGDCRGEGRPIRKTGGFSSGPLALMQMVNEGGRWIRQGGDRRSAIWAGLPWDHPDIQKFITMKNWSEEVRAMKAKDYNFPATMDGTNISVGLDDKFFKAYADDKHEHHSLAQGVYWATVRQMLKTAEPGFSVNTGSNRGENLRNAPVCAETMVLTKNGYVPAIQLVGVRSTVWTGKRWAQDVLFTQTSDAALTVVVTMTGGREIRCDSSHPFLVERYAGAGDRRELIGIERRAAASLLPGDVLHVSMPLTPKNEEAFHQDAYLLGYVYGDGNFTAPGGADITFCTEESKACAQVIRTSPLVSSINDCDGRGYVRAYMNVASYWKNRSKEVFPKELYKSPPQEAGSFIAGLMDADGNWEPQQKRLRLSSKHEGFLRGVARLLEQYGILAGVSRAGHSTFGQTQTYQLVVMSEFNQRFADFVPTVRVKPLLGGYMPYRASLIKVLSVEEAGMAPVFCADVHQPEHSFQAEGVIISNCTEITSRDDSDICNLGSINMANIESLEEMAKVVDLGTAFLLAGTVYSDVPYGKVDGVRTKNRRLGLGLMGIHEWLLKHGKKYGPDEELAKYLEIYAKSTDLAVRWAKEWDLTPPVKTRAIAPTGTIGIIAETTTGMEPIFCVAYKRRYLKGNVINYQYVIDPAAQRLIESGIAPEAIEDAYVLAENVERRVAFQAWLQQFVDHSISSTINIPAWGSELNNESRVREFGDMLMKYLPELRGITCYPDGARGGQPLTPVAYKTAIKHIGEIFDEVVLEQADVCDITKGGSCGA